MITTYYLSGSRIDVIHSQQDLMCVARFLFTVKILTVNIVHVDSNLDSTVAFVTTKLIRL